MRKLTRDFHLFELEYDIGIQIESRWQIYFKVFPIISGC